MAACPACGKTGEHTESCRKVMLDALNAERGT